MKLNVFKTMTKEQIQILREECKTTMVQLDRIEELGEYIKEIEDYQGTDFKGSHPNTLIIYNRFILKYDLEWEVEHHSLLNKLKAKLDELINELKK